MAVPPGIAPDRLRLRRLATGDLTTPEITALRSLLVAAFGSDDHERFTDDDWAHAIGGTHFVLDLDGAIASHASVVEREIRVGGRPLRTGYVEAVATATASRGLGLGSIVMADVTAWIRERFELGALGTGRQRFYERLGWRRWTGPSLVRTPDGDRPTAEDDGFILVLSTPSSPPLDRAASITCDWRPGDVW
jgi:aminoglycoside 2'-N-acetyltransferase I